MSAIMAIDPGGKSGIAIRMPDQTLITCICESIFLKDGKRTYDPTQLYEMFESNVLSHVIVETFQAQTITKDGLHTVRLVGAVEALCWKLKIPLTKHMPIDRRPFQNKANELLQGRRVMVHERDATAHLLRYEHDTNR